MSKRSACGALVFVAISVCAVPVFAGSKISGRSPLSADCGGGQPLIDSEVEPSAAVNPTNPLNIVVVWQQDRYRSSASRGHVLGVTFDGGKVWQQVVVPGLTECSGGARFNLATDPWLSFGAPTAGSSESILYLSSYVTRRNHATGVPEEFTMVVSTSRDGGRTWSQPVDIAQPVLAVIDKELVAGDPVRPGHAYAVWAADSGCYVGNQPPCLGGILFSMTRDGGSTWSSPRPIETNEKTCLPSQLLVLGDGTLLLFCIHRPLPNERIDSLPILAMRSTDLGATWLSATVAQVPNHILLDPDDPNTSIRAPAFLMQAAAAPSGRIYAVWQNNTAIDRGGIALSTSDDGGRSWSQVRELTSIRAQAFVPMVAVGKDEGVAVTWYDLRTDSPLDELLTTQVWIAHSSDGGATWIQREIAGPFDMRKSPLMTGGIKGYFLGDYQGLVPVPGGFVAAFAVPDSGVADQSDIFMRRIQVKP